MGIHGDNQTHPRYLFLLALHRSQDLASLLVKYEMVLQGFAAFAPCITGKAGKRCIQPESIQTFSTTVPLRKEVLKRTADKVTNGDWEDRWPLLTQVVT